MTKQLIPFLFILIVFAGACGERRQSGPATPGPDTVSSDSVRPWWREAVFYEIFVRSFYDSNADGIGDFNGLTQKLDYLQDLGITGIWLMPIHPSPSYHGYDVTDYYAVNPQYGTPDDFSRLLSEAHARGIRIIIDLALNHTSNQHPFFKDALRDPNSIYRDWYIWSETDNGDGWHVLPNGYYYGLFCGCMPDLNYHNPEVTTEMENVVRFWLNDMGVDGFRVDAAKHLIEDGVVVENTPATHAWYQGFYTSYKAMDPDAYAIGEVYGAGALMIKSYTGDQLDQVFSFEMASGFVNSAAGASNSGVNSALIFSSQNMPDFNFATFLTNHDQNRVMSVLNGYVDKAKIAASLLLTSPGTPFIYYGEEIGLQGKKPDEDIRLPMQWSGSSAAGFTQGRPWREPNADFQQVNVAVQQQDPDSLLNHYRTLIQLRSSHAALRSNQIYVLKTGNPAVYASLRVDKNEIVLVIVNLTDEPVSDYSLAAQDVPLTDGAYGVQTLFGGGQAEGGVLSESKSPSVTGGTFSGYQPLDELSPFKTYLIQLIPPN